MQKNRLLALSQAVLLAAGTLSAANAQEANLESQVVSGGGGSSSKGDVTMRGTLGQPAVGVVDGDGTILRGGFWRGGLSVLVEPDGSFDQWMENLPESAKPPEDERGPEDEPAGDGLSNLLKYALGLMPMTPSPDAAPTVTITEAGFLGIEFERSKDAAVTFQLEGSPDFEQWSDLPFGEEFIDSDLTDGRERIKLLSGFKAGQHQKYFIRLRVKME